MDYCVSMEQFDGEKKKIGISNSTETKSLISQNKETNLCLDTKVLIGCEEHIHLQQTVATGNYFSQNCPYHN